MEKNGRLEVRTAFAQVQPADAALTREAGLEEEQTVIQVDVLDTGPGIAEGKEDKVFDPFFTTKPTGQGTGLGLSVTRNIIKLHDGYISIRNRPEGGARACILFRAQQGEQG
jgi:signal transduction histidine kinase